MSVSHSKASPKKRFAIGAEVRVKLPGVNGTITQMDTSPTVMGEYWHTVRTERGERREPGSNLELIPLPVTNAEPNEPSSAFAREKLLLPEQAIPLLRAQLQKAVETLPHDNPDVDGWERVALGIVEGAFGKHSRNAKQFAVTFSKARQSDEEAQAWHIENVKSKKGMLRAFIKELEIIPPRRPQVQDDRFARMAVDEARKSTAEDHRAHPMVGCVVVKDGRVLATAHRGEVEGNHAEFIALEKKLGDVTLTGCTVYTTLEPCTTRHDPKIPCADRLIERKVARVVIGTLDPNPEIRGKGMWKLQQANIAVEMFPHALTMELNELNRHFFRSFAESRGVADQAQEGRKRFVVEKPKFSKKSSALVTSTGARRATRDTSLEPQADSSCDFSPRALLVSKELSVKAFPVIQESSWSEEIELMVAAETSEIDSIFSRFRGHKEVLVVAYGFDVAVAKLKAINRITSAKKALWKIWLDPVRTDFSNDMEMGTSDTSADEFAEKRVRRLLLNESPMAIKSGKDDMVGRANELMHESLIQGLNSIVKIRHSTFIDLHTDFSDDPVKFTEIAWISAVADLKLSASIQHIDHLTLELNRNVLNVDFSGRRHRNYVNLSPYKINVTGSMTFPPED
ncbi:MAG: deaminase [Acidobacteriaceae bacterium]